MFFAVADNHRLAHNFCLDIEFGVPVELVSTSFKERIDVFNAHYREESNCFLNFDFHSQNRQRVIVFNDFGVGIHLAWDNGIKYCFLNIPIAVGKPDFTSLAFELSQIGEIVKQ